jgi:hypothetical protein
MCPALLGAPGGGRWGEVLGGLKSRLGAQETACGPGHERVWGEVIIPLKAATCKQTPACYHSTIRPGGLGTGVLPWRRAF